MPAAKCLSRGVNGVGAARHNVASPQIFLLWYLIHTVWIPARSIAARKRGLGCTYGAGCNNGASAHLPPSTGLNWLVVATFNLLMPSELVVTGVEQSLRGI